MAQLRALLAKLGFQQVATLLASGNAVFTSAKKAEAIRTTLEKALEQEFGFPVEVVLRTRDELAAVIARNPLPGADEAPSKFLVVFSSEKLPAAQVEALDPQRYAPDEVAVRGRELYARFPNGIGRSKLATILMGPKFARGGTATARNWGTVKKLLALAEAGG